MNATAPKLAELRAKTDRELVKIIGNALEIDPMIAPAHTDGDSAVQLHAIAKEIYTETLMLIPKVEDVHERRRLEERVNQLREGLEGQRFEGAVL